MDDDLILLHPHPLTPQHDAAEFDCGVDSLNVWLRKTALKNQSQYSRTFVLATPDHRVMGYYCLSAGTVRRQDYPKPMRRNAPDPIPILKLGRLAVHRDLQGQGYGEALLRESIERTYEVSRNAGLAALMLDTTSADVAKWYARYGFLPLPDEPATLFLPLSVIEALIEGAAAD